MSPGSLSVEQFIFILILVVSFTLLVTERMRSDVVALLIVLSLAITGLLSVEEAFAGFSSEPAIIIVAIFVLSRALQQTGVSEDLGKLIGRFVGHSYQQAVAVIMPGVALFSAFTHHVATTAFMIPVILDLSRERNIPVSKLLMPLAFAASLGTTITIIGAPAFLIASTVLVQAGRPGLSIFSIAPIGLGLTFLGTVYMLLVGNWLLPIRQESRDVISHLRLDRYFTELTIPDESPLVGKTLEEAKALRQYQFTVAGWIREGSRLPGPFAPLVLAAGDVLLLHTTPEDLLAFHQDSGVELHSLEKFKEHVSGGANHQKDDDAGNKFVQAVVAPRSEMIGRTLRDVDFRRRYGPLVVAFWRRRSFIQKELARIKLLAGDVLVLQGDEDALSRVGRDPAFLMLVPFHGEARLRRKAPLALTILVATIAAAIFNVASLQVVMMAGALAMVLSGCLSTSQAYRAVDVRIYVFIAGAIPLGAAMQSTGISDLVARWLQATLGDWSPILILLAIFAVVSLITQFLSDSATVALFAPLAAALAQALDHAPEAYVITVAMASVASLLTPIGHHGNLLIYSLGGYRFSDFLRVGTPLTVLIALVVVFLSMWLWPL